MRSTPPRTGLSGGGRLTARGSEQPTRASSNETVARRRAGPARDTSGGTRNPDPFNGRRPEKDGDFG
jgi:hypothetical protein